MPERPGSWAGLLGSYRDQMALEYKPTPLDTSQVQLGPDILGLTEELARHCHEAWAQLRLAQGWRYGPQRDDARKEHPCLVPYHQLPESEKEYDRNTALRVLKAVLALGYRISKP
jgi:hypothetical protein